VNHELRLCLFCLACNYESDELSSKLHSVCFAEFLLYLKNLRYILHYIFLYLLSFLRVCEIHSREIKGKHFV